MRMLRPGIDAQIAQLDPRQRPARQHALDRLLHHALGKFALEDRLGRALLDATDIAGVVVIDFLVALAPGQHRLGGIDDDDVVTAVDMGCEDRQVLAPQPHRDNGGEPADDHAVGVDHHPFLLDFGGLGRVSAHGFVYRPER